MGVSGHGRSQVAIAQYLAMVARGIGIAGCVAMHGGAAFAAESTGTANVAVERLVTLSQDTPLSFGVIATNSKQCIVTLSPAGAINCPGQPFQFSGAATPATFTVGGNSNTPVTISFSSGDSLTGPGSAMTLNNFQHDAGATPVLDGGGWLTFNVGADLRIKNNQVSGNYTGSYTISVNYQ